MNDNCSIIPTVVTENGEVKKSILFQDLLKYAKDRDSAKDLYLVTQSKYFIDNWAPKMDKDANGECKINELLHKTNLMDRIDMNKLANKLTTDIGGWTDIANRKKLYLYNQKEYDKLYDKCVRFNKSDYSDKFVATVDKVEDNETGKWYFSPTVRVRNAEYSMQSDEMVYNHELNNQLSSILDRWGIHIGSLSTEEENSGINGITDFTQADKLADGLSTLIRVAHGDNGQAALPEEFSHVLIRAFKDDPLVHRLVSVIQDNGLSKDILGDNYDKYNMAYGGKEQALAEESAGQLLGKHLSDPNSIPEAPYKSLLSRFIDKIKGYFSNLSLSTVDKARIAAQDAVSQLAKQVYDGYYDDKFDSGSLLSTHDNEGKLFQVKDVQDKLDGNDLVLKNIMDRELKRYKIFESRNPGGEYNIAQADKIRKMEEDIKQHQAVRGINTFLNNSLNTLTVLNDRLRDFSKGTMGLRDKFKLLRDIRNYTFSYDNSIKEIRDAMISDEQLSKQSYTKDMVDTLDKTAALIEEAKSRYNANATPLFTQFIKAFADKDVVIPFGKDKGKTMTVEQMIKESDRDITFIDRWVDSMSNSPDYMLKLFDQSVKASKEKKRLRVIDFSKQVVAAASKLRSSGVDGFEWMFEHDKDGNKTGNYISPIDWGKVKDAKTAFFKQMEAKYGRNPMNEAGSQYRAEVAKWYSDNYTTVNGVRTPIEAKYRNNDFYNLSPAQKEFYSTYKDLVDSLKDLLPETAFKNPNQAIQIRKDLMERILSSGNLMDMSKEFKESMKDQLVDRSDDNEFGMASDVEDFEGKKVRQIPIYYNNKLENPESMSTDCVSTAIAFADMAINYDEMNKVVDALEVGRDLMKDRTIGQTRSGRPLVEKVNTLGKKVSLRLNKNGESNFMARLNDFFDSQVYGIYMKDAGKIGKINTNKAVFVINKMTSLNSLAVNLLSGVSTILHDITQINAEAVAGQFFSAKDLLKADRNYFSGIADSMEDVGSRVKTSKFNLFLEKFNVLQEYEEQARDNKFDKGRFQRLMSTNTLYFLMHCGDHWGQSRIALALANAYKMKAPDGKIVGLYDALETKPIDPSNPQYGATLEVKPGYTKADGSEFTQQDISDFTRKAMAVNERMFGIYNKADRNAIQAHALGSMAIMYRKYLVPSMRRRFASADYNMDLQDYTEGYYRTTGRFLGQLFKDLKDTKLVWGTRYNELSDAEKYNIKRAVTETSQWLAMCTTVSLMGLSHQDMKKVWNLRLLEYFATRLKTDIGSLTPTPYMISDLWKIMKSPAAGMETLENLGGMLKAVSPAAWMTTVNSGRFKGHSQGLKAIMSSPFVPGYATIYRAIHPEQAIQAYK